MPGRERDTDGESRKDRQTNREMKTERESENKLGQAQDRLLLGLI